MHVYKRQWTRGKQMSTIKNGIWCHVAERNVGQNIKNSTKRDIFCLDKKQSKIPYKLSQMFLLNVPNKCHPKWKLCVKNVDLAFENVRFCAENSFCHLNGNFKSNSVAQQKMYCNKQSFELSNEKRCQYQRQQHQRTNKWFLFCFDNIIRWIALAFHKTHALFFYRSNVRVSGKGLLLLMTNSRVFIEIWTEIPSFRHSHTSNCRMGLWIMEPIEE